MENQIGNLFLVDKKIDKKVIIIAFASAFIGAILKFLLENQKISDNISIQDFAYGLLVVAIILFITKIRIIYKFFDKYLIKQINWLVILYVLFYIIFFYLFVSLPISDRLKPFAYLAAILFSISGLQGFIITKTNALFFSDLEEFMDFIQVYGYIRAGFFATTVFGLPMMVEEKLSLLGLIFSLILFLFAIWPISNLNPYCIRDKDVLNSIRIIRIIAEKKSLTGEEIAKLLTVSERFLQIQLPRLIFQKYLAIKKDKIQLSEDYKLIYLNRV